MGKKSNPEWKSLGRGVRQAAKDRDESRLKRLIDGATPSNRARLASVAPAWVEHGHLDAESAAFLAPFLSTRNQVDRVMEQGAPLPQARPVQPPAPRSRGTRASAAPRKGGRGSTVSFNVFLDDGSANTEGLEAAVRADFTYTS